MFEVTYKLSSDEKLALSFFDQPDSVNQESTAAARIDSGNAEINDDFYYDHVLLLTPSVNNFKSVDMTVEKLLEFFDSGRNIYIGLDETTKSFGRDLLKEFGAELFPQKSRVLGGNKKNVNISGSVKENEVAFSSNLFTPIRKNIVDFEGPAVVKGTGMKVDTNNELVFPILQGENETHATSPSSGKKKKEGTFKVKGNNITLVAGYQSRHNQRVVMSGSVDMCSDAFIATTAAKANDHDSSSNYQLCMNILLWTFQQKSVLKIQNFDHSLVDKSLAERGLQKEQEYKLKDEIQVSFDILEKVNGKWVPFRSKDVQIQFIMLNPYVTETLQNVEGSKYTTQFHVPDHNGVYKFMVDYNKHGYTHLHLEKIAPVRVLNHDEFPRFSPSAYPYYIAVLAVVAGFVVFTVSFIMTEDSVQKSKVKQD